MIEPLQLLDYDGPGQSDYMCGGTFSLAELERYNGIEGKNLVVKNKKGKEKGYILVKHFELRNSESNNNQRMTTHRAIRLDSDC